MNYELRDVLIKLDGVTVTYGTTPVLSGLSAEVRDIVRPDCVTGQIVGILGPSGVGKSQLSRVMSGLMDPTSGKVTVRTALGARGTPVGYVGVSAGMVGYVAQNYPLLRHRTVLDNLKVAAARAGHGHEEVRNKSWEYLRTFGLEDKADRYPAELSGGQRQRIAIAQQLLCSEHYLILDEPTTGLDPIAKDKVCELIRQVAGLSEENTIFVVTHDIASILSIADHLWLLGRERDEKGQSKGARIMQTYDLIERGIAWQPDPYRMPAFAELQHEIRERFETL